MTREMIQNARENAKKGKYVNVEFRLGEVENTTGLKVPNVSFITA